MGEPTLFDAAGVDVPTGRRAMSRRDARKLAERAVNALYGDWDGYDDRLRAVARDAAERGAWRVARALRWMASPAAANRYGWERTSIRTERVIERWLRDVEVGDDG